MAKKIKFCSGSLHASSVFYRGHVELRTDPAMHPVQYPKIYLDTMNEGER